MKKQINMLTKRVKLPFVLGLSSVLIFGLHSCDNEIIDPEPVSVSKKINPGYLDVNTGLRIASFNSDECGDALFFYSDDGKIDYITRNTNHKYSFNPDCDEISYTYRNPHNELCDENGNYSFGYNESGYLSSVSITIQGQEGDESVSTNWTERGGISFSYDNKGHLERMYYSMRDSWNTRYSNGNTDNGTGYYIISMDFYWQNDVISRMEVIIKEIDDNGEEEVEKYKISYNYDNPEYVNKYRQITPFTALYLWDEIDLFTCMGWLGVGPEMLPSGGFSEYVFEEDGKRESGSGTGIFQYEFTDAGAVLRCKVGDIDQKTESYCDFSYDYGVIK